VKYQEELEIRAGDADYSEDPSKPTAERLYYPSWREAIVTPRSWSKWSYVDLHDDHLGSTDVITNAAGAVVVTRRSASR
jgi:hypothetical protein